ncbi:stalk domain-containing protein [Paenibacillus albus]|uniref:Copper amine oxidase-like N-terminal domain-containing protein n=1 Tax=Paenibacillus albus TaxID=2495582 RepID=A0A3S9A5M9_9BACL|nr:stalk domain-containing protein [Paenibacillus albus]AZN41023.1 hypothetical protein EJC50_16135 [Paenibacillus albus]
MKRMVVILMTAAALLTTSLYSNAAPAVHAEAQLSDPQHDIAKMYRIKHQLQMTQLSTKALLDGKPIEISQPLVREGRVFVSLRTLRLSGAAKSVNWDPVKRTVHIVMNKEVGPPLGEVIFRIGSDQIYTSDGMPMRDPAIAKPFLQEGTAYVPVADLTMLGMYAEMKGQSISWSWSDKFIEMFTTRWETDQEQVTFSMLYQKDMDPPQYLRIEDSTSGSGGSGYVTAKNIALDGRLYYRYQFTVKLRPGVNPLMLAATTTVSGHFEVKRLIADPSTVPIQKLGPDGENLVFTKPTAGYVPLKPNEPLALEGTITQLNPLFDKLTAEVEQYRPDAKGTWQIYKPVQQVELPIVDQRFEGELRFTEKGSYIVTIMSPKYMGPEQLRTPWARLIVEVE